MKHIQGKPFFSQNRLCTTSENEIPTDKSGKMTAGPINTLGFQDRLSGIALSFDFGYYN
jgi:hypothetical protein